MQRKSIALAALVLALALFASCAIPDYQLGFNITNTIIDGVNDTVTISYSLHNIGYEKLIDASIRIVVDTDSETRTAWTSPVDLSVSESVSDSLTFYFLMAPTNPIAYVTGSAWDTEDDSGWF
jgi:hypothetical protein